MKSSSQPSRKVNNLNDLSRVVKKIGHVKLLGEFESLIILGSEAHKAVLKCANGHITDRELGEIFDKLQKLQRAFVDECHQSKITLSNWQTQLSAESLHEFFLRKHGNH